MQYAITRQAPGGINQQAMAAIENALLDVKAQVARRSGLSSCSAARCATALPLYWSHCGSYRFRNRRDDGRRAGALARRRGEARQACEGDAASRRSRPTSSASTATRPTCTSRASGRHRAGPELNCRRRHARSDRRRTVAAFRAGRGPDMGILLDTNFNFRTEGYIKVARGLRARQSVLARDRLPRSRGRCA